MYADKWILYRLVMEDDHTPRMQVRAFDTREEGEVAQAMLQDEWYLAPPVGERNARDWAHVQRRE